MPSPDIAQGSKITTQGHLAKVRIDLADTGKALRAFWDTDESHYDLQIHVLQGALEALLRAVSTLTQVVEAQEQSQRKRDDCAEAYGGYVSW